MLGGRLAERGGFAAKAAIVDAVPKRLVPRSSYVERSSLRSSKGIVYEPGLTASCEYVSIAIYLSSHSRQ